jgi:hypothetical protein
MSRLSIVGGQVARSGYRRSVVWESIRGWLIGEDVAIANAKAINEQQTADQGEFAQVVIADNGDAPAPIIEGHSLYLDQVILIEPFRECRMVPDLLLTERGCVDRVHASQVMVDVRGWRRRWGLGYCHFTAP